MIKKYTYGTPIITESTVLDIKTENGSLCYFNDTLDKDKLTLTYTLDKQDIVYGLGESVRGINKRGWFYESYCSDDPVHTESKSSLYGAHNFIMVYGTKCFGMFIDSPAKIKYDIGYTRADTIEISTDDANLDIYIIDGDSAKDIVTQFRTLIGTSYMAPFWAFGFQQSRWSYCDHTQVDAVYQSYKNAGIPLDAIYLDIDYMDSYKDFTIDDKKFPNFESFTKNLKSNGVRLVPIIDAGVKAEQGYDVCGEGIENGYFCKDKDGKDYVTAVWPGLTYFPDFLNSNARKWFGDKYKYLIDMGIEGFWNDMNEPAIFYSKKGLDKAWERLKEFEDKELDVNSFFEARDVFAQLSNSQEDYNSFYHNMDGKMVCHNKVHNMYGYNMTRAAADSINELQPNKRTLLFSRASLVGMHRYGGIWTGDNQSWWSHIELSIKQMPSLNMCGFLYIGSDIGGFGANATADLVLRWLAFGIFTPLMRNHSAMGTRDQECYSFGDTADFKNIVEVRYKLLPYLYSEYMKAVLKNEMYFKPLAFDYPADSRTHTIEDQLMVGESIMITPVYTQNATGRYVYLPEDMMYVSFADGSITTQIMTKGDHYITVELNEVPMFIKKNCIVPMYTPADCTDHINKNEIQILGYVTDKAEYQLYEDDGYTKNADLSRLITITVTANNTDFTASCTADKSIAINVTGE